MAKEEKRLEKMRANPKDWRIEDLQVIADSLGIEYKGTGGSHVVFRCVQYCHLTVPAKRPIKPVYIKQFLALVERVRGNEDDNGSEE